MKIATCLYHCTRLNNLKNIIQSHEYWPSYCLEKADYMDDPYDFAFAMVSFADLLPIEVKPHMKKFRADCYLKMSKVWARKNGISNVLYYDKKSVVAVTIKLMIKELVDRLANHDEKSAKQKDYMSLFMAYCKQYEGYYWNDNDMTWSAEKTAFYTEREWRYVPIVTNGEAFYLDPEDFKNKPFRSNKKKELLSDSRYRLHFDWSDVEEIGVSGFLNYISFVKWLVKNQGVSLFFALRKSKRV